MWSSFIFFSFFFPLLLEKMKHKEVISLKYTEAVIAGSRQPDFQGPKGLLRSPHINTMVLTGMWVNKEVGVGFL